jgi:hypothetical protein
MSRPAVVIRGESGMVHMPVRRTKKEAEMGALQFKISLGGKKMLVRPYLKK